MGRKLIESDEERLLRKKAAQKLYYEKHKEELRKIAMDNYLNVAKLDPERMKRNLERTKARYHRIKSEKQQIIQVQ